MKLEIEGDVKLGSHAKANHPETPTPRENKIQICNSR